MKRCVILCGLSLLLFLSCERPSEGELKLEKYIEETRRDPFSKEVTLIFQKKYHDFLAFNAPDSINKSATKFLVNVDFLLMNKAKDSLVFIYYLDILSENKLYILACPALFKNNELFIQYDCAGAATIYKLNDVDYKDLNKEEILISMHKESLKTLVAHEDILSCGFDNGFVGRVLDRD